MSSHSKGAVTIQPGIGRYICSECGRRYRTGDGLVTHQSEDHDFLADGFVALDVDGEQVRACRHCWERFDDPDKLVDHLTDVHDHFTRVLLEEGSTHE